MVSKYLKSQNVALALMTNGNAKVQREKVNMFNLDQYFDAVLIEGETGLRKPDKRVYQEALKRLELKSKEVWAIGDNLEWDVWGPQQIGIHGIWHDFRQVGLPSSSTIQPDRIIHSISELVPREG